ncbi:MAG: zinc-ribbon domain-containing protein [Elusimicrobia bacterium]|nr:zinc-ribbon domain-containing protein [Elusimicrobiota bacterium]
MRCPKCNNENPDDAVSCPSCHAPLLNGGPVVPQPVRIQVPQMVVLGIALATLLIVFGFLRLIGGRGALEPAVADSPALKEGALDRAFSEARAAGGGKVVLERVALLTAAAVVDKNVPSQTFGTYAGWVLKKAQSVLAESGRDCQVTVQVTLHAAALPDFEVSAGQAKPEAVLLQRLRQELKSLGPLHTSAQDVSFAAYFTVNSGAPAVAAAAEPRRAKAAKRDWEALRQACAVEIGMFCNDEKAQPKSLESCLRGHSHDLLPACRQSLSIPEE